MEVKWQYFSCAQREADRLCISPSCIYSTVLRWGRERAQQHVGITKDDQGKGEIAHSSSSCTERLSQQRYRKGEQRATKALQQVHDLSDMLSPRNVG